MSPASRQTRRAWYGAALIAGLIGLGVLVFVLDDIIAAFERRYAVVVVLDRAPGLVEGSPVWLGGKQVGQVLSVAFLPGSRDTLVNIAVTIELPRGLRHHVRADSHVRLTSAHFVGDPVVDVQPGTLAARELVPGDTLRMPLRPSFESLAAAAVSVRASMDTVVRQAQLIGPPLRARMRDMIGSFAALDRALVEANVLQRDIAASPALATLADTAFAASLARSRAHAAALASLLSPNAPRAALQRDVREALARFGGRADSLSALLDATEAAFDGGFLVRSQRDSALFHALTTARAQLDSLIAESKRNPLRFVF